MFHILKTRGELNLPLKQNPLPQGWDESNIVHTIACLGTTWIGASAWERQIYDLNDQGLLDWGVMAKMKQLLFTQLEQNVNPPRSALGIHQDPLPNHTNSQLVIGVNTIMEDDELQYITGIPSKSSKWSIEHVCKWRDPLPNQLLNVKECHLQRAYELAKRERPDRRKWIILSKASDRVSQIPLKILVKSFKNYPLQLHNQLTSLQLSTNPSSIH